MANLFIPPLGTEIELAEDWRFWLFCEHRNDKIINVLAPLPQRAIPDFSELPKDEQLKALNASGWRRSDGASFESVREFYHCGTTCAEVMLPAGTRLKVQRLYIRMGQRAFDSVTFSVSGLPKNAAELLPALAKKKASSLGRFWVKLADANQIKLVSP